MPKCHISAHLHSWSFPRSPDSIWHLLAGQCLHTGRGRPSQGTPNDLWAHPGPSAEPWFQKGSLVNKSFPLARSGFICKISWQFTARILTEKNPCFCGRGPIKWDLHILRVTLLDGQVLLWMPYYTWENRGLMENLKPPTKSFWELIF